MECLFLSRAEYDRLIARYPAWMATKWSNYSKQWNLIGVYVTGTSVDIKNLLIQLEWVNQQH